MGGKRTKQKAAASGEKATKQLESPTSFYGKNPTWSFSRCDFEHERWGFCNCHDCLDEFKTMIFHLRDLEQQRWADILMATSGNKKHTRNHEVSIGELVSEAKDRWDALHYNEWGDSAYSLRYDGTGRIWGIIEDGTFYIIWIDKKHEIYPSTKRHT